MYKNCCDCEHYDPGHYDSDTGATYPAVCVYILNLSESMQTDEGELIAEALGPILMELSGLGRCPHKKVYQPRNRETLRDALNKRTNNEN